MHWKKVEKIFKKFTSHFKIPLSKNVTLTIEVPNADHAGMMERMEAWCDEDSIPKIMQDTGVLIQFPDLVPDAKNGNDFVNRVSSTMDNQIGR